MAILRTAPKCQPRTSSKSRKQVNPGEASAPQGNEGYGVNCEPAWLPFGQKSVAPLAVCRVPAGEGREKHGAQSLQS